MKPRQLARWAFLAAVGAVPVMVSERAQGQFPAQQEGRALDANMRIGSGGYNQRTNPYDVGVTGNRIVTGNVTGGKEFRGNVPYTDPREFRGALPSGNIDNFIRGSAGIASGPRSPRTAWETAGFYGAKLVGTPPPGFVERGYTGTYTPAPQTPGREQPEQGTAGPLGTSLLYTPSGGEMFLQGPADSLTNQSTVLTASPLLGLRQWNAAQMPDWALLSNRGLQQWNVLDRVRLDRRTVEQLQEELRNTGGETAPGTGEPSGAGANRPSNNLAQPLPRPFDAPENRALTARPMDSSLNAGAMTGQVRPEQAIADRFAVAPTQQSSQYAELQRRLDRYYTSRMQTDEERYRDFLTQLRAKEGTDRTGKGLTEELGVGPAAGQGPGATGARRPEVGSPDYGRMSQELLTSPTGANRMGAPPQTQPFRKPQPMPVESLAAGVRAQGLANGLRNAEDLMRQGKYLSALEQYGITERATPNNPLVWLGRAHAELAGAYYRKAEQDLRQALTKDPTLLMGQYDLKAMIGQERLESLVRDLKETAKRQEKDPGPVFLLAYLAYNTGNASSAAMYLNEAEKRAGGKDRFYSLLRMHWSLPGEEGATAVPGAAAVPTFALSDVLKQFEEGNVLSATLSKDELSGEFRTAVAAGVGKANEKTFKVQLPAGAGSGPLAKWIQEHRQGADVKIEGAGPSTQPSGK